MDAPAPETLSLVERDHDMLAMVFWFGGVVADHLLRRFFPTEGARSACYARVAKLVRARYLSSVRLPSQSGQGSGKAFLVIGPTARPLLAARLGLTRSELNDLKHGFTPLFVAHHLAICDFRLSLEMACERSQLLSLLEWESERELRRSPMRVKDPQTEDSIPLIPDGAFTIALADGTEQPFYLEVDMATITVKRFKAKLRAYLAHSRDDPTPVLFVVPDTARQAAMAHWAKEEAEKLSADPTIFWVTARDRIDELSILFSPIWQVVGGPQALPLIERPASPISRPVSASGLVRFQEVGR